MTELEKKIGYEFKDKKLLTHALTHSSYANEKHLSYGSNERLEFLGDSVLGVITAEYFYQNFELPEGELTKLRASTVCEESLFTFAKELDLGSYLLLGKGEIRTRGNERPSILSDAFESVIAAIYLDGGMSEAETFVKRFLLKKPEYSEKKVKDYKSELQIYSQSIKAGTPKYQIVSRTGPDHDPLFTISVEVAGVRTAGSGKSKAEASQKAAQRALKKITGRNN